jgi:hypothetical protein
MPIFDEVDSNTPLITTSTQRADALSASIDGLILANRKPIASRGARRSRASGALVSAPTEVRGTPLFI